MRLFRSIALLALLIAAASAQQPGGGLIPTPPAPSTRPAPPAAPFVYRTKLPQTPVATIDGAPVTQAELLDFALNTNFSTVAQTITMGKVLELELKSSGLEITDKEVANEVAAIINRMSPGKTPEDVAKSGAMSLKELNRQGWLQRAMDVLFKRDQTAAGAPVTPEAVSAGNNPTDNIMKTLFVRRLMEKYEIRMRGKDPAPEPGLIAEIKPKGEGPTVAVTAEEGLDFLMGLVRPAALVDAVNDLVDARLATEACKKAGKSVAPEEVEAWAATMTAKYPPPFDWATISRIKGTSVEGERERWRKIQCWKRATGIEPTEADLKAFLAENTDYFSGQIKNVSHILIKTRDDITGFDKSEEEKAAAKKTVETLNKKAQQGVDFAFLAKTYSEDTATATNGGALPQPVKKFGGAIDPAFQKAAYALQPDETTVVKSTFGWHVIKCDKVTPGRDGIDFAQPMYQEFIRDEYETARMKSWLEGLRTSMKVEKAPVENLWKLKEMRFTP
jgi:hypothetical protein